ncbi:uncharacterized protein LOC114309248 [Camellia sinensis]|uniref:uncharacterized protein LOC114309248 n=1 Tax=Camellia sinensis TaxID=4442 RepID=UPI001035F3DF|nr:uncharacterized protein LOC114309248 [Camellia sinensis]
MDAFIMLMCCYQSTNVAYNSQSPHTYDKLAEFVCSKFKELTPGNILFFFKIPGYNEFTLQNDVDVENMLCLAWSFQLHVVDVVVKQNLGVDTWIQSNNQSVSGKLSLHRPSELDNFEIDDEVDLLQTFCPHNDKGCNWNVHARKLEANRFFYLRKWVSEHTCGVAIRASTNRLVGSDLVVNIMAEQIRDRPLTRPTEVILNMKQDYGLDITYRVAWFGVEKARGWYSAAVMEHNPGSYVTLKHDEHTHRFTKYFISFKACIDGFTHCRPLIFLDATFLKGHFKGFLLVATAKDGNQGLFPLAFAVVDSENTTNWSWFLQSLAHVLNGDRPLTFISDRNAGLLEATPTVFSNAEHAFCLQHLQRNLCDRLRYTNSMHRAGLVSKLPHCAYVPTVIAFNDKLEQFHKSGRGVASEFLATTPPQHWANAFFRGRRYGEMCSNDAESFNSWIREACNLPVTRMIDSIRAKIMNQMSKHRDASQSWTGTICPKMESRLEKAFNKGRSWRVSQSNADVYEVHSFSSVTVNIGTQTCSCFQWQLNWFPCAHAMVAVRKNGHDLNDLVEPYFHVSEYRSTYAASIFPIPTVKQPPFDPYDYLINPSVVKRPLGRLKKKRILLRGEHVQQIHYVRCGRMGNHNRKTCNEPI